MKKKLFRFWPIIVITALWLAFSAPYFFRGLVPFPSTYLVTFFPPWNSEYGMPVKNNAMPDVITQIYPWKRLTIETWKDGAIPLWNPFSFSGTPLAANYQSAVFSPINLLFFFLPFLDAWSLSVLLQPLLAGLGMYLFLRRIARSQTGSTVGAIAFMFCGFMTTWMAYGTLGYAVAFLPWALWGVATDFLRKSAVSRIVLAASIALSFVSGHFQISIYVLIAVVAFIVFQSIRRRCFSQGVSLLLWALAGVLIASPQLLLTLDAYRASVRSTSFVKAEVIPWQYVITAFAPDFYGNPVTRNDWFGHYAEWSSYVGIVPLVLAIFAVAGKIKEQRLFFVLLGAGAFLFAYPTPLNEILFRIKLPALSTSASSRIIVLLSFSLASLAAFGFDDLAESWRTRKYRAILLYVLAGTLVLGLLWGFLIFGKSFPVDALMIAKRNSVLPTIAAVFAFSFILLGMLPAKWMRLASVAGILALTLFDSYRFAAKWMPFEPREYVYPSIKSLEFLKSRVGVDRVFGNIGNESAGMAGLQLIEGYDAVYQGRYSEFINATSKGSISSGGRSVVQFDKHGDYKTIALQLLGVRYIYHRWSDGKNSWTFPYWEYTGDQSMRPIYNDEMYQVLEYTGAFPRAFLASSYTIATDGNIIHTLFDKDFDRRETLVLEEKPALAPAKGDGKVTVLSYKPNAVVIKTVSSVPKLLFLSDVFDPGWQVSIDGASSKIYRANYDFRAVTVPAGEHIVRFAYFPKSLRYGFFLSALALILVVGNARRTIHEHRHI